MLQAGATRKPLPALSKNQALLKVKVRLLEIIKAKSLLSGGTFKLASGGTTDYYLDMKPTTFDPEGATLTAEIVYSLLRDDPDIDAIGGLELGCVPIVAAVCALSWRDHPIQGFVVRKEKKGHGTDKKIDGNFTDNSTVVLIDDVTTKGGSVMEAVRAVRERGATIKKIITVVDRLEGAAENLKKEGIDLEPIYTARDLLR
ncbi:MAG TPA: orotate phosphoribosyltransferase [Xanthobacteraceae bacterium]|jgi:orotate phosphoribosyltransferase|nr:orotate phosphoribosyltransferase [Xanthobacteraceae bacterium]